MKTLFLLCFLLKNVFKKSEIALLSLQVQEVCDIPEIPQGISRNRRRPVFNRKSTLPVPEVRGILVEA